MLTGVEKMRSVKISTENYRRLYRLMGKMMNEKGRRVTMGEALKYLFEKAGEHDA